MRGIPRDGEAHSSATEVFAMSVQWSERPIDLNPLEPGATSSWDGAPGYPNYPIALTGGGDGISLNVPQSGGTFGSYGEYGAYGQSNSSMLSQLVSMLQQLLGSNGSSGGYGNEQYFTSASGGSNGDPHLSFNGSTWNDMQSEPDLLHSTSVRGGYQLSTQTTAPNANGITYNQSATVTTHNGNTSVTLTNGGIAELTQNGVTSQIAPGQTLDLGNETVTRNANGSLQIVCSGRNGAQLTTTLSQNGSGVDANVSASNVELGGTMVRHADG
jgi:hypothetical protein